MSDGHVLSGRSKSSEGCDNISLQRPRSGAHPGRDRARRRAKPVRNRTVCSATSRDQEGAIWTTGWRKNLSGCT